MQLTDKQRELLTCLSEEAAEVIQVISKILRHGLYSEYPETGERNDSYLWNELNDFGALWDQVVEEGIVYPVSDDHLDLIWDRKKKWMHYCT